jgi:hypothetical protein
MMRFFIGLFFQHRQPCSVLMTVVLGGVDSFHGPSAALVAKDHWSAYQFPLLCEVQFLGLPL